ncbi:alcohol dehydrogenase family protein [Vibrio jasicida]|uniref:alcohol dehydrogenase family protein n=1 Tax=Vibrio jasicida TaxID=766224 RepID=UPI0036F1A3E9
MTTLPTTMKGVLLTGHGGPEMLEYRQDIPVPTPKENEVLIRVSAAGVNNTDINTRIGWYSKGDNDSEDASWSGNALVLPRIQGADVCGEIVAAGSMVDESRIGERVLIEPCLSDVNGETINPPWYFGSECDGGFAEYTVVSSKHAYQLKTDLTDVELASFPCSYSTAENMLTRSRVAKGDRVLISGASGGVGSAAIQLAKARGATVIAITSPSKNEQVLDLGADEVVPRNTNLVEALGNNSVDVVIDLVAGDQWPQFLEVLRPKGRYAVSGAIGGAMVELDVRTLYLKDLSFFGCTVLEPEVFGNLVHHIEQGNIKPLVAQTFPLEDINQAQAAFQEKGHVGKMVLTVK